MRALMITVGTLIFAAGFVAGGRLQPPVGAQGFTVAMDCGVSSASQVSAQRSISGSRGRRAQSPSSSGRYSCATK